MFKPNRSHGSGGYQGGKKFGEKRPWDRDGGGRDGGRPMMHSATCAECGNACEVPFRPIEGRPVFCSNCFKRDGGDEPRSFGKPEFRKPSFGDKQLFKAVCDECGDSCEVPFRPTGDKLVYCRQCFKKEGAPEHKSADRSGEQLAAISAKLDAVLKALNALTVPKTVEKEIKTVEKESVTEEKVTPKKADKKKAAPKKKK